MKVALLSTSDVGGAGLAAKQLHLALRRHQVGSTFVTKLNLGGAIPHHEVLRAPAQGWFTSRFRRLLFKAGLYESPEKYYLAGRSPVFEHFSFPWSDIEPYRSPTISEAEIIHLHWVSDGFIDYRRIFKAGRRYVWTLHDMNPFTGGCHYSAGCPKFTGNCNYCFQLYGTRDEYLSGKILRYKQEALSVVPDNGLVVVTPSAWLAEQTSRSTLFSRFRHVVVPNVCIPPAELPDRAIVRRELGIAPEEVVVLFVSHNLNNPRKGLRTFLQAAASVNVQHVLMSIGERTSDDLPAQSRNLQLGFINERQRLFELYAAADLFVLPSKADNFPNTIVEAHLVGTPVLASNVGGIPEQINDRNGILVKSDDPGAWAEALSAVVASPDRFNRGEIRKQALDRYDTDKLVGSHLDIYRSLLQ